jgi:hypothetical protein
LDRGNDFAKRGLDFSPVFLSDLAKPRRKIRLCVHASKIEAISVSDANNDRISCEQVPFFTKDDEPSTGKT